MENFEFKGHPENADAAYWEAEKVKWLNGSDGLTGRYYFYLTIFSLCKPDQISKYKDCEKYVFDMYEYAIKVKNTFVITAPKEFDAQSIFGASESLYISMIQKNSTVLITSSVFKNVKNIFDKITGGIAFMPDAIRPLINCRRKGWFLGLNSPWTNQIVGKSSSTANGVEALTAWRCDHVFIDDGFNHKRLLPVFQSAKHCIGEGFNTVGKIVVSAISDGEKKIGTDQFEDFIIDHQKHELTLCVIPER